MSWDRQDLGGIDWGDPVVRDHPNNHGLVAWWLPLPGWNSGPRLPNILALGDNGARASHGTLTDGPTWATGLNGFGAIDSTGSGTQSAKTTAAVGLPSATLSPFTITYAHQTRNYVFLSSPFGFGGDPHDATLPNDGRIRGVLQFNNNYYVWGASADWDTGVGYDTDALPHLISVTFDGASRTLYRDGVLAAGPSTTGVASLAVPGTYLWANERHASGNSPDAKFLGGMVHDRALSDGEVAALHSQWRRGYPDLLNRVRPWSFGTSVGGGGKVTKNTRIRPLGKSLGMKRFLSKLGK
jgi:hypothetical protein